MARTFNGTIWGGIGDKVARDAAIRMEETKEALGGLLDMAKFLEKANSNRKLRQDWQDYFANRKAAQDAAASSSAAASAAEMPVSIDEVSPLMSIFIDDKIVPNGMDSSIWGGNGLGGEAVGFDPSMTANGYEPTFAPEDYEFIRNFNPKTATPEEILMAQRIVGTDDDGKWGPNSKAAYKKFMTGRV